MTNNSFSCQRLVRHLFQYPQALPTTRGKAIAVTAAHPGAGVSYISRLLTHTLNAEAPNSTVLLDGATLLSPSGLGEMSAAVHRSIRTDRDQEENSFDKGATDQVVTAAPAQPWERLHAFRQRYTNLIIDMPSLKENCDLLSLCPYLNGVVIVVEANKTNRHQLAYLERSIQESSGVVLGHILNKRTYPIPPWLNTQLERLGL